MKNKKTLLIVCITCMLNMVMALNFSWSLYESSLHDMAGWTHTQASLPLTVFSLCYSLFVTPTGLFQDRFGPRKTIFFGSIIAACGLVICGLTMTVPGVVIGFGVIYPLGMVAAYSANVGNAMRSVPVEKRGTVSGIVISAVGVSGIISAEVSAAVINRLGISPAFFSLAIYTTPVMMLGVALLGRVPAQAPTRRPPRAERIRKHDGKKSAARNAAEAERAADGASETDAAVRPVYDEKTPFAPELAGQINLTLRQTIRTRRFYLLVLVNLLGCMANSSVSTHIVSIAKLQAGVPAERAQIFVTLVAICNFAGRLATGFVSDLVPRKRILTVMFALDTAVIALFRFFTSGVLIGLGIGLVTLTGASLMVLVPVLITDYFGPLYYGQNYGIVNTFAIVNSLMPVIVGQIIDRTGSYNGSYLLGTVLAGITLVLTFFLPKTGGRRRGAPQADKA